MLASGVANTMVGSSYNFAFITLIRITGRSGFLHIADFPVQAFYGSVAARRDYMLSNLHSQPVEVDQAFRRLRGCRSSSFLLPERGWKRAAISEAGSSWPLRVGIKSAASGKRVSSASSVPGSGADRCRYPRRRPTRADGDSARAEDLAEVCPRWPPRERMWPELPAHLPVLHMAVLGEQQDFPSSASRATMYARLSAIITPRMPSRSVDPRILDSRASRHDNSGAAARPRHAAMPPDSDPHRCWPRAPAGVSVARLIRSSVSMRSAVASADNPTDLLGSIDAAGSPSRRLSQAARRCVRGASGRCRCRSRQVVEGNVQRAGLGYRCRSSRSGYRSHRTGSWPDGKHCTAASTRQAPRRPEPF